MTACHVMLFVQIQFKGTRPGPVEVDVILNGERVRGCPFMCHQLDISDWGTPEVVEWITELGYPECGAASASRIDFL